MAWSLREAVVTYRKGNRVELERRVSSSRVVNELMHSATPLAHIPHAPAEYFVALALDAKNRIIGFEVVSKGGISACPVEPASVFRGLLLQCAVGVVFVHNHPSGDPSPSPDDEALTERLRLAGQLLGIRVLDHVIVVEDSDRYFSFLDQGVLQ